MSVPPDLQAALDAHAAAAAAWAGLDAANRYAVLYRLHDAKPTARAAKVEGLVRMLAEGRRIHVNG